MLLSILYLALFICVGLLLARRAVPDGSAAVILPLGCGFGVSLLAVCCFAAMFGSVLTVGREIFSDYQHWSANDIALADYIDANAESDALFLTSDSHVTPVFALAGRRILCGSGSYVYYHGMDYADEYSAMAALYEHPNEGTLAAWDVGYVLFDSSVYGKFADADESWYAARYPIWYENDGCRVYKIV